MSLSFPLSPGVHGGRTPVLPPGLDRTTETECILPTAEPPCSARIVGSAPRKTPAQAQSGPGPSCPSPSQNAPPVRSYSFRQAPVPAASMKNVIPSLKSPYVGSVNSTDSIECEVDRHWVHSRPVPEIQLTHAGALELGDRLERGGHRPVFVHHGYRMLGGQK